jgi:hypothetical protein
MTHDFGLTDWRGGDRLKDMTICRLSSSVSLLVFQPMVCQGIVATKKSDFAESLFSFLLPSVLESSSFFSLCDFT